MPSARFPDPPRAGIDPAFAHIDCWIFDLDNTLYPPACNLFELINARIGAYVDRLLGCGLAEAQIIQRRFYEEHGATLTGLMAHHGVDPQDFLADVHDIPLDRLTPDPALIAAIAALPGRRLVYTNGDAPYAARVLEALGLAPYVSAIHDIVACDYRPKPDPYGYGLLMERHGIDPACAIFFEDMARNLAPAKALGLMTVWFDNGVEGGAAVPADGSRGSQADFIDYEARDLAPFLRRILGEDP